MSNTFGNMSKEEREKARQAEQERLREKNKAEHPANPTPPKTGTETEVDGNVTTEKGGTAQRRDAGLDD